MVIRGTGVKEKELFTPNAGMDREVDSAEHWWEGMESGW